MASWHNALAGLAVIVLAVLQHTRPARRPLAGAVLVALAIWLLVAPWLLGYGSMLLRDSEPGQATWNRPSRPRSCWPPLRSTRLRSAVGPSARRPKGLDLFAMTLSLPTPELVDVKPDDHAGRQLVEEWLRAYAAGRDPELRDRIVRAYLGMADRLAERFRRSRNTSPEDLRQAARLGLLTAIHRYDPDRADRFVPYAVACIVGEMKRHLRDTTWRVAVPRQTKELALRVCQTADELTGELGRPATAADVADALDLDEQAVLEAMGAARSRLQTSLDEPLWNRPDLALTDLIADDAEDALADRDDLILLPQLVAALPEPERTAVWLYYFEERTQREIGELTGRCQMSVSRLLRQALQRLRSELLAAAPDPRPTERPAKDRRAARRRSSRPAARPSLGGTAGGVGGA